MILSLSTIAILLELNFETYPITNYHHALLGLTVNDSSVFTLALCTIALSLIYPCYRNTQLLDTYKTIRDSLYKHQIQS